MTKNEICDIIRVWNSWEVKRGKMLKMKDTEYQILDEQRKSLYKERQAIKDERKVMGDQIELGQKEDRVNRALWAISQRRKEIRNGTNL